MSAATAWSHQREYPTLALEDIRAAAAYGAQLARDENPAVAAT